MIVHTVGAGGGVWKMQRYGPLNRLSLGCGMWDDDILRDLFDDRDGELIYQLPQSFKS